MHYYTVNIVESSEYLPVPMLLNLCAYFRASLILKTKMYCAKRTKKEMKKIKKKVKFMKKKVKSANVLPKLPKFGFPFWVTDVKKSEFNFKKLQVKM